MSGAAATMFRKGDIAPASQHGLRYQTVGSGMSIQTLRAT
jgi:hypothetical protein